MSKKPTVNEAFGAEAWSDTDTTGIITRFTLPSGEAARIRISRPVAEYLAHTLNDALKPRTDECRDMLDKL